MSALHSGNFFPVCSSVALLTATVPGRGHRVAFVIGQWAPVLHPPKGGSSPLGTQIRVRIFHRGSKYCHNGGHGLRPPTSELRRRGQGSVNGPSRRSPDSAPLQGKGCEGPGSASFGGSDGLVWLSRRQQVLTQRGHDLRRQLAAAEAPSSAAGVHDRHLWPLFGTLRSCLFAGKMSWVTGADAFGCADELEWLATLQPERSIR
jgi:hypothetical protein